jgi:hypothetical protein
MEPSAEKDPVVEELAAVWWSGANPDGQWSPGCSPLAYAGAKAVLDNAGLRERIGAWEPPPDVAEMAAEALWAMEAERCNSPSWAAIPASLRQRRVADTRRLIADGWTLTPPSEGGQ